MTVEQIYHQYQIPLNLQKHQLRVAAVIQTMLDQENVILAGLFHDMANLIKFNFSLPDMLEDRDNHYWQQVQTQFISQYGSDVHQATISICQQIGLPTAVIKMIDQAEWDATPQLIGSNQLSTCLLIYADMRVGPHGVLSYQDRILNLANRNSKVDANKHLTDAKNLEEYLTSKIDFNPKLITDASIALTMSKLPEIEVSRP